MFFAIKSFGGHVISAMATEIKQTGLGQVYRLTLLDPGTIVQDFEVDGKIQQGLIHKVKYIFVTIINQEELIFYLNSHRA